MIEIMSLFEGLYLRTADKVYRGYPGKPFEQTTFVFLFQTNIRYPKLSRQPVPVIGRRGSFGFLLRTDYNKN